MTYGYRLNVEQLLLKNANEYWEEASTKFVEVSDSVPETGAALTILAPEFDDDKTISQCIQAVLGWSIATEAFINLVWQNCPDTAEIDERNFRGTVSKIKHLCKTVQIEYGAVSWRGNLVELFNLRDHLVHYKDSITYVGFSFAPKFQRDFSKEFMKGYQNAVICLFKMFGEFFNVDISFLNGEYDLFFYDE